MQRRQFVTTLAAAGLIGAGIRPSFAQGKLEKTKVAIAVGGKNLFYCRSRLPNA